MASPREIIDVLHSIKEVRLNNEGELEIKFNTPSLTFPDGWEPNTGFIYGSFTHQLLLLIEDFLIENCTKEQDL